MHASHPALHAQNARKNKLTKWRAAPPPAPPTSNTSSIHSLYNRKRKKTNYLDPSTLHALNGANSANKNVFCIYSSSSSKEKSTRPILVYEFLELWSKQVCFILLFENASKISHFCLDSISLVSTNFWILSSMSVSPRSNLSAKPCLLYTSPSPRDY